MTMVWGLDLHSTSDHVRCGGGGVRRGVEGPVVAAGSGAVSTVVARRRDASGARRPGGVGGGGLHRLALRGGGGRRGGVRGAPRRAGRYAGGAGSQASRQDRSLRLSAAARVVGGRASARVVDPADGGVGVARTGAAVQVAGRSAHDVGAADPRRAVSAWGGPARELDSLGQDQGGTGGRRARVEPGGPSTHRRGLSDDRRDHRRVGRSSPTCSVSGITSRPVGPWPTANTGSAGCSPWRCGPNSATVVASPAPSRWCATADWT